MNKNALVALSTALALSGCATVEKSILLGAGVGAAAGTSIGLAVEKSPGSALIGAGIGALVAGTVGYLAFKDKECKEATLHVSSENHEPKVPMLTRPEVRRMWIPDKTEDGKYEEGHYIYIIDKPATWSK